MGRYSPGTLDDTRVLARGRRTMLRTLNAAATPGGTRPYHTTDKVRSMDVDLRDVMGTATRALDAATLLGDRLGRSTVVSAHATGFQAIGQILKLTLPAPPGVGSALAVVAVTGCVRADAAFTPQVTFAYTDAATGEQTVSWPATWADGAAALTAADGGMRGLNGSMCVDAAPGSDILISLAYTSSTQPDPSTWGVSDNVVRAGVRVDYTPPPTSDGTDTDTDTTNGDES